MPSPRVLLRSIGLTSVMLLAFGAFLLAWRWSDQRHLGALPTLLPSLTPLATQIEPQATPTPSPTAGPSLPLSLAPTVPPSPPPTMATTAPERAGATSAPTAVPTLPGGAVVGVVAPDGRGLRLRVAPDGNAAILNHLIPGDVLTVTGRTDDTVWLQVVTARPEAGWVMAQWVTLPMPVAQVPVFGVGMAALPLAVPTYVVFPNGGRMQALWAAARAKGRELRVFAVVGDSNSWKAEFLKPFATPGAYQLSDYAPMLQPAIDYWGASFGRQSVAAQIGFDTLKVQQADYAQNWPECAGGETPLACELRVTRASVVLILLGTNDQYLWFEFESRSRALLEYVLAQGAIPVLFTKADANETGFAADPDAFNGILRRLAAEYGVPLIDARLLTDTLPTHGLEPDGYHLNLPPDGQAANLDTAHLAYGYPARNLAALWALWALWQSGGAVP